MESFLKKVINGNSDNESHRYFIRFGKGNYKKRFLITFSCNSKIKIKTSFELANDLVKFVKEHSKTKFSGKVLAKEKIAERNYRKKAGVYVYEIENSSLEEFENPYFILADAKDDKINLRIKKSLPKPGKEEEKVDDSFCILEADMSYLNLLREYLLWDVPECKKAKIEHEVIINEIIFPQGEKDPAKIRELAKRKGKIIRKINYDEKEILKEYNFEA